MRVSRRAIFLASGLLAACPAFAWGVAGHRVIANIAESAISPRARQEVRRLLFDGKFDLAAISTCADEIRAARGGKPLEHPYCGELAGDLTENTGPWHYIDIPVPAIGHDLEAWCPQGSCVVQKLEDFARLLRESTDDAERRRALMFIVHLAGDIYQPLHCAERGCDQGGNREHVDFQLGPGERLNKTLHSLWDRDLVEYAMRRDGYTEERSYASFLAGGVEAAEARRWAARTWAEIAWEGNRLASAVAYREIAFRNFCGQGSTEDPLPGSESKLSRSYERRGAALARNRLREAGIHLAAVLDEQLAGNTER